MPGQWWDKLPRAAALSPRDRLWVPMQMQALVFGATGSASFLELTPYYENLAFSGARLGYRLRRDYDATDDPDFLSPWKDADSRGIHLHWMLPAAFAHVRPIVSKGQSSVLLPPVPNRWLVVRLWEQGGKLQSRPWVVESDFRNAPDASTPWLDEDAGQSTYSLATLGRTTELADWTETASPPREPLTAFAPGNPGFASYYPACRGVFGLHDRVEDLPDNTDCSYLVAGWFAGGKGDPLSASEPSDETGGGPETLREASKDPEPVRLKKRWLRRMWRLQWAIPETSTALPTGGVTCYAMIHGVRWSAAMRCDAPQTPSVTVALGNSVIEAAAALTTRLHQTAHPDQLISELQLAALAERRPTRADVADPTLLGAIGALPGGRAKVHERSFSARDGGAFWEIVPDEPGPGEEANAQPLAELPTAVAAQLARLNEWQRGFDVATRMLAGRQRRLFAAWYQLRYWEQQADKTPNLAEIERNFSKCRSDLEQDLHAINQQPHLRRDGTALRQAQEALDTLLQGLTPRARLVRRAMPRFWRANDPFVLLTGLTLPSIQEGASPLQCRVGDSSISGVTVNLVHYGTLAITRDTLTGLLAELRPLLAVPGIPTDVEALLMEALYVDPAWVPTVWRQSRPTPAEQITEITTMLGRVRGAIDEAVRAGRAIEHVDGDGRHVEVAVGASSIRIRGPGVAALLSLFSAINPAQGKPPRPVFMHWQVQWRPHGPDQAGARGRWEFTDGVDYHWTGAGRPDEGHTTDFAGFTVIAAGIEQGLAVTQETFGTANYPLNGLAPTQSGPSLALVGQSLMGLTEALGTQDSGLQLPPLITPSVDATNLRRDTEIARLIGDRYDIGPLLGRPDEGSGASPFAPVRGGFFALTRLWIVDSFGRVQTLSVNDPVRSLALGRSLPGLPAQLACLPPRLVQPARLLLRWLSAISDKQESLGDLSTSPICGFIVPNRLDRLLLIYGSSSAAPMSVGRLLGAVQAVLYADGRESVHWSPMPARPQSGAPAAGARRAVDANDILNPHLRAFVNGLLQLAQGDVFKTFRALLDRHEESSDLSLDQGLQSVLIGRPLALVRAALRLELDGPPLTDQSAAPVLNNQPLDRQPEYLSLQLPVRIGDRRLGPDGLIGYFVDDGSDNVYRHIHLSAGLKPDGLEGYAADGDQRLSLTCDPGAEVKLTLLLDPKQGVHLVSGILPVSLLGLPQPLVAAALADLTIPVLVAPVLGDRLVDPPDKADARTRMPLPTSSHGEWTWTFFAGDATVPREMQASAETEAAPSLSKLMALHEGWLMYHASQATR